MPSSSALGEYLRARRARLRPTDVGLPVGPGLRRTPGLRREELAALAGVSIDYYIRLEQGKENNPSPAVLEALGRALRLDAEERAHLLALADHAAGRVPAARSVLDDWDKAARTSAAQLRSLTATDPNDPALAALIDELNGADPGFAALWKRHDVHARRGDRKTFHHPRVGTFTLDFEVLHLGADRQRMSVYQAEPGTPDHDAMVLLSLSTSDARS